MANKKKTLKIFKNNKKKEEKSEIKKKFQEKKRVSFSILRQVKQVPQKSVNK